MYRTSVCGSVSTILTEDDVESQRNISSFNSTYIPPSSNHTSANVAISIAPVGGHRPAVPLASSFVLDPTAEPDVDANPDSAIYASPVYSAPVPTEPERSGIFQFAYFHQRGEPHPADTSGMLRFADQKVRHGFVFKVFSLLGLMFTFTIGFTCMCLFTPGIKAYVSSTQYLFWVSWVLSLVMVIAMTIAVDWRRNYPSNMIMLVLFTLVQAWMVGMISCFFDTDMVLISFASTVAVVFLVSVFAVQTKWDVTDKGIYFLVPLATVVVFIIVAFFWANKWWSIAVAACVCLFFGCYMVYDIQLMLGGKTYSISPDDYVFAALSIFLDIVQFFIAFLSLISFSSGKTTFTSTV